MCSELSFAAVVYDIGQSRWLAIPSHDDQSRVVLSYTGRLNLRHCVTDVTGVKGGGGHSTPGYYRDLARCLFFSFFGPTISCWCCADSFSGACIGVVHQISGRWAVGAQGSHPLYWWVPTKHTHGGGAFLIVSLALLRRRPVIWHIGIDRQS